MQPERPHSILFCFVVDVGVEIRLQTAQTRLWGRHKRAPQTCVSMPRTVGQFLNDCSRTSYSTGCCHIECLFPMDRTIRELLAITWTQLVSDRLLRTTSRLSNERYI